MTLLPPEVPGPNPGQAGHYAHHDWHTASVKALDEAVLDIVRDDWNWQKPGLTPGWEGNGQLIWARRSGIITMICNLGKAGNATSGETICTLPPEARPMDFTGTGAVLLLVGQAGGGIRSATLSVAGVLAAGEAQTPGALWGTFTYIGADMSVALNLPGEPVPTPPDTGFGTG